MHALASAHMMLGETVRAIIFANYDNYNAKYEVFHAVERNLLEPTHRKIKSLDFHTNTSPLVTTQSNCWLLPSSKYNPLGYSVRK
jgi:hypothetical protein